MSRSGSEGDGGSFKEVVLGVDGGGTKTECCLMDALERKVISRGISPGSNMNSVGERECRTRVERAVSSAVGRANEEMGGCTVVCACLSMSGINRDADVERHLEIFKDLFPAETRLVVNNDSCAALASVTKGNMFGGVLIVGTGTCAVAFSVDGKMHRTSGWGPLFRDGGSTYDIAQGALAAIARAHDGRGESTDLTRLFMDHLNVSSPEDLLPWAYESSEWSKVASLAPLVFRAAEGGDKTALSIVHGAVNDLVTSIETVLKKAGLAQNKDEFPFVLAGGAVTNDSIFSRTLLQKVREKITHAQVSIQSTSSCVGAAWIALSEHVRSSGRA